MFLFIILLLIVAILAVFLILTLSVFGAGALIIFGDVIICILLIGWIIKKLFFNRK
jgi:hypothetical protein